MVGCANYYSACPFGRQPQKDRRNFQVGAWQGTVADSRREHQSRQRRWALIDWWWLRKVPPDKFPTIERDKSNAVNQTRDKNRYRAAVGTRAKPTGSTRAAGPCPQRAA